MSSKYLMYKVSLFLLFLFITGCSSGGGNGDALPSSTLGTYSISEFRIASGSDSFQLSWKNPSPDSGAIINNFILEVSIYNKTSGASIDEESIDIQANTNHTIIKSSFTINTIQVTSVGGAGSRISIVQLNPAFTYSFLIRVRFLESIHDVRAKAEESKREILDNIRSRTLPVSSDRDGDGKLDVEDDDIDGDGKENFQDTCPAGEIGWISNHSTDYDGDGCSDGYAEELDDDNDGKENLADNCQRGLIGGGNDWDRIASGQGVNDRDDDGCRDNDEDTVLAILPMGISFTGLFSSGTGGLLLNWTNPVRVFSWNISSVIVDDPILGRVVELSGANVSLAYEGNSSYQAYGLSLGINYNFRIGLRFDNDRVWGGWVSRQVVYSLPDYDDDGVADIVDSCPRGESRWVSDNSTDHDGDGCRDGYAEEDDDDNDGVRNQFDILCGRGEIGWISNHSTDYDGDGCRDGYAEELDDDNDGKENLADNCQRGLIGGGNDWDRIASGQGVNDRDDDGCRDNDEDTVLAILPMGISFTGLFSSGTGGLLLNWTNPVRVFSWNISSVIVDDPILGREVELSGANVSLAYEGNSSYQAYGLFLGINYNFRIGLRFDNDRVWGGWVSRQVVYSLPDYDDDGVADIVDSCPRGESRWVSDNSTDHDADGCRDGYAEEDDDDNDGVRNQFDILCGRGEIGWISNHSTDYDGDGCRDGYAEELDDDNDGKENLADNCQRGLIGGGNDWDRIASGQGVNDRDDDGCRDNDEDTVLAILPMGISFTGLFSSGTGGLLLNWTNPVRVFSWNISSVIVDDPILGRVVELSGANVSLAYEGNSSYQAYGLFLGINYNFRIGLRFDNDRVWGGWVSRQVVYSLPDYDDDGVADIVDSCPRGESRWVSDNSTDHDGDGCRDGYAEEDDDDNDGVRNQFDILCGRGEIGWISNHSTDYDGDGCRDGYAEELDDDNDGKENLADNCQRGLIGGGNDWDRIASGQGVNDRDDDGCRDNDEDTVLAILPMGISFTGLFSSGAGGLLLNWTNPVRVFSWNISSVIVDDPILGREVELSGANVSLAYEGNSSYQAYGLFLGINYNFRIGLRFDNDRVWGGWVSRQVVYFAVDSDSDNIGNLNDLCPNGESGWISNSRTDYDGDGCRDGYAEEDDDDNDGKENLADNCPRGLIGGGNDWDRVVSGRGVNDRDDDGCRDEDEDTVLAIPELQVNSVRWVSYGVGNLLLTWINPARSSSWDISSVTLDPSISEIGATVVLSIISLDYKGVSVYALSGFSLGDTFTLNISLMFDNGRVSGGWVSRQIVYSLPDYDDDGVADIVDSCRRGESRWVSDNSTDYDGDGCRDGYAEEDDDDNDGVRNQFDILCGRGEIGWISNRSTDYDGDGCRDGYAEEQDDDSDGKENLADNCPRGLIGGGNDWDRIVSGQRTNDLDDDGCRDEDEDTTIAIFSLGVSLTGLVSSGNGGVLLKWVNPSRIFPWGISSVIVDDPILGREVELSGANVSLAYEGSSSYQAYGLSPGINYNFRIGLRFDNDRVWGGWISQQIVHLEMDIDNDGIEDTNDACSDGERGWVSNNRTDNDGDGCRDSHAEDDDDDNDSVLDQFDLVCGRGEVGWTSNRSNDYDGDGCRDGYPEEKDDDNDGKENLADNCPRGLIGGGNDWDRIVSGQGANDLDDDGCRDEDEDTVLAISDTGVSSVRAVPFGADGLILRWSNPVRIFTWNISSVFLDDPISGGEIELSGANISLAYGGSSSYVTSGLSVGTNYNFRIGLRFDNDRVEGRQVSYIFTYTQLDTDGDNVADIADNCPLVPNPDQNDHDGDASDADAATNPLKGGDVCDGDADNDGILNSADLCDSDGPFSTIINQTSTSSWQSTSVTDFDRDGCRDREEDIDDDNDGLIEILNAYQLNMTRNDLKGRSLSGNRRGCGHNSGCFGYELAADIDLSSFSNWRPIGGGCATFFCGTQFDSIFVGHNYTIKNLSIETYWESGVGLFGIATDLSQFHNVHIRNATIIAHNSRDVGAILGLGLGAFVYNSSVEGLSISSSAFDVGGLVGSGASIVSSHAIIDHISGSSGVGGLIGSTKFGSVIIGYSYVVGGSIIGSESTGGLVGELSKDNDVIASFASLVLIQAGNTIGGLVGYADINADIHHSYATTETIKGGFSSTGGLVGYAPGANIKASYSISKHIDAFDASGLIGYPLSSRNIEDSYWSQSVKFSRTADRRARNNGARNNDPGIALHINDMRTPTKFSGPGSGANEIYANWADAWCDPLSGAFTATDDETSLTTDANRVWNLGSATDMPRLNCFDRKDRGLAIQDSIFNSDEDGDLMWDLADHCPDGEKNWVSNHSSDYDGDGCRDGSAEELDDDNDGVFNAFDHCRRGVMLWTSSTVNFDINGDGCRDADEQRLDADDDGLIDISSVQQLNIIVRHDIRDKAISSGRWNGICGESFISACTGYELTRDVDLADFANWQPLGGCDGHACAGGSQKFNATFDGNNHRILNAKIYRNENSYGVGIFGAAAAGSEFRNLGLNGVSISKSDGILLNYAGALVGHSEEASFRVINISVDSIEGTDYLGGLVGYGLRGDFINISSSIEAISGRSKLGALAGYGRESMIRSSDIFVRSIKGRDMLGGLIGSGDLADVAFSSVGAGNIAATNDNAGGLIGIGDDASIRASFANLGLIQGRNAVGGFMGKAEGLNTLSSYVKAREVKGVNYVGGLLGHGGGTKIDDSYAFIDRLHADAANAAVDGLVGNSATANDIQVADSYWVDSVSYSGMPRRGGNGAGTPLSLDQMTNPVRFSDSVVAVGQIYANWSDAWCDPAAGLFTTTDDDTYLTTDAYYAWRFGGRNNLPFLSCFVSLDNQMDILLPRISFLGIFGQDLDDDGIANEKDYDYDGDGLIEIITAEDLDNIRLDFSGRTLGGNSVGCALVQGKSSCTGYELGSDIDLAGYGFWQPIGGCSTAACDNPFTGKLIGNGHTISNVRINLGESVYGGGFFAALGRDSEVLNLHLRNVWINFVNASTGSENIGGLAGYAEDAGIISSSVAGLTIEGQAANVGGLLGYGDGVEISSSYVGEGNIEGSSGVGGLAGAMDNSIIRASYAAAGRIKGDNNVGGILGRGDGTRLSFSYAVTNELDFRSSGDALVGNSGGTTGLEVSDSYWAETVLFSSATPSSGANADMALMPVVMQRPVSFNDDAFGFGKIYANWEDAWCDPISGEFTTDPANEIALAGNRAWNLGSTRDLPRLSCFGLAAVIEQDRILRHPLASDTDGDGIVDNDDFCPFGEDGGDPRTIVNDPDGDGCRQTYSVCDAIRVDSATYGTDTAKDPLEDYQWYLPKIGVHGAWNKQVTGEGIEISVVDTGFQLDHEDLAVNFLPGASLNVIVPSRSAYKKYPYPISCVDSPGSHGTAVSGIIGAVGGNKRGIRGIAYGAKLWAGNLLDSNSIFTSRLMEVFNHRVEETAVSSNSWGQAGISAQLQPVDSAFAGLIEEGISKGFYGKGISYLWAGGNSHQAFYSNDKTSYSGYLNHRGVIPVCAVGSDDMVSAYSERGPNLWVCGYSNSGRGGANSYDRQDITPLISAANPAFHIFTLPTTDLGGPSAGYNFGRSTSFSRGSSCTVGQFTSRPFDFASPHLLIDAQCALANNRTVPLPWPPGATASYTRYFGGTSGATPVVAGVIGLIRSANKDLSWRDVKLILAASSWLPPSVDPIAGASTYNDAQSNYSYHPTYGFGIVNASKAVDLALNNWTLVPAEINWQSGVIDSLNDLNTAPPINFVEHVVVDIQGGQRYDDFGDLRIELISPANRSSVFTDPHRCVGFSARGFFPTDDCPAFEQSFSFLSAAHLGESPSGRWRLRVTDAVGNEVSLRWKLVIYGH